MYNNNHNNNNNKNNNKPPFYSHYTKTDDFVTAQFYRHMALLMGASVLRRCWIGGRKGIRPVKTEWLGAGVVIYLERGVDLHIAQLMPLPLTVSCFSKIQIDFTFLVPAHLGSPGQRANKQLCVCALADGNQCIWTREIMLQF